MAVQINNTQNTRPQTTQTVGTGVKTQGPQSLSTNINVIAAANVALESLASSAVQLKAPTAEVLAQGEGASSQTTAMIQQHFEPLREFLQAPRTAGAPADQWQLPFTLQAQPQQAATPEMLMLVTSEDPIAAWSETGARVATVLEPEFADANATKENLQDSLRMLSAETWSPAGVDKQLEQLQPGLSTLVASPQVQQVIQQKLMPLLARMTSGEPGSTRMKGDNTIKALGDVSGKLGNATSPTEKRALLDAMKAVGSALSMPDLGSMDVESAVQMIMMLIAKDAREDMKIKVNDMKVKLREKKMMRTEIQLRKAERAHINEQVRREYEILSKSGTISCSFEDFRAQYPFGVNEPKRNNETGEVTLVYGGISSPPWSERPDLIPESLLAPPPPVETAADVGAGQVDGASAPSGPVAADPAKCDGPFVAKQFEEVFGLNAESMAQLESWWMKSVNQLDFEPKDNGTQFKAFLLKLGLKPVITGDKGAADANRELINAALKKEKAAPSTANEDEWGKAFAKVMSQLLSDIAKASNPMNEGALLKTIDSFMSNVAGMKEAGMGTSKDAIMKTINETMSLIGGLAGQNNNLAVKVKAAEAATKVPADAAQIKAHIDDISDELLADFAAKGKALSPSGNAKTNVAPAPSAPNASTLDGPFEASKFESVFGLDAAGMKELYTWWNKSINHLDFEPKDNGTQFKAFLLKLGLKPVAPGNTSAAEANRALINKALTKEKNEPATANEKAWGKAIADTMDAMAKELALALGPPADSKKLSAAMGNFTALAESLKTQGVGEYRDQIETKMKAMFDKANKFAGSKDSNAVTADIISESLLQIGSISVSAHFNLVSDSLFAKFNSSSSIVTKAPAAPPSSELDGNYNAAKFAGAFGMDETSMNMLHDWFMSGTPNGTGTEFKAFLQKMGLRTVKPGDIKAAKENLTKVKDAIIGSKAMESSGHVKLKVSDALMLHFTGAVPAAKATPPAAPAAASAAPAAPVQQAQPQTPVVLGADSQPVGKRMSAGEYDTMIDGLQSSLEAKTEMDEMDQLALDEAVKRSSKAMEMLSNLMKKFNDTQSSIIKNMT
jgi:hypothetical protein